MVTSRSQLVHAFITVDHSWSFAALLVVEVYKIWKSKLIKVGQLKPQNIEDFVVTCYNLVLHNKYVTSIFTQKLNFKNLQIVSNKDTLYCTKY